MHKIIKKKIVKICIKKSFSFLLNCSFNYWQLIKKEHDPGFSSLLLDAQYSKKRERHCAMLNAKSSSSLFPLSQTQEK